MYEVGDSLTGRLSIREGKTTAPKLFSDGDLIDVMKQVVDYVKVESEEMRRMLGGSGIGTGRTRDAIITGLFDKDLLMLKTTSGGRKSKIVIPTPKGLELWEVLKSYAPQLTNPLLTAQWEAALTMIESGTVTFEQFLGKQKTFQASLINSMKDNIKVTAPPPKEVIEPIDGHGDVCDKCGIGHMVTRATKADKDKKFLACDNTKQINGKWVGCDNVKWSK